MEIGKIYKLDNELIRLEKVHKSGIHVFKVVDQFGNDVVKRKGNVIIDYFVQLDQDTKNKYMHQFNFFSPELKRRGL